MAVGAVGILTAFTGTSAICALTKPVAKSFRKGGVIMEDLSSRRIARTLLEVVYAPGDHQADSAG
jgi:hypothetical protein